MTATTFYWHDYETFGRFPKRDRPAQFAGIRTDADLNEIGAPSMHYCRPAPDYLPDPESCLLTGILPQTCLARGLPEHAFAELIRAQLAEPGTIGVGYNSIRFDDEVTRHLFWRCLMDPYGREWQNDCGRWDLLDVVRLTWALRPDGIAWPLHDDGRPSFKLEHLARANGLLHEAAHDALSDVRATIAVARLIKARQPRLWDYCLSLRRRDEVIRQIGTARPFLHLSSMYGTERGGLALVWPLAPHPSNRNEVIVWDLAHDPAELFTLDADRIRQRLFSRADELPEGVSRLPIKTVHLNRSPIVIGNLRTLSAERAAYWGLDVARAMRHAEASAVQAHAMADIWRAVFERPPRAEPADVDEDLYGDLIGDDDRRILERLIGTSPLELAGKRPAFEDKRLAELLFRYRARNFPETLSQAERQRWHAHCADRLHKGSAGSLTVAQYFERIDRLGEALAESGDERSQDILGALVDYATDITPEPN